MKDTYPAKKRNITFRYEINSSLAAAGIPAFSASVKPKKLRRLPHIFCRVLELPFDSEAPVLVEENRECFRFVINTEVVFEEVRAEVIEIVPGVTKVVIGEANRLRIGLNELELDKWRFRLPSSTLPELSSAVYTDGELVVTVPKYVVNSATGEEDYGLSVESKEEDLGEEGVNSEAKIGADDGSGRSENREEEGSRRVQSEGQSLLESGVRLNHGMHNLVPKQDALMGTVRLVGSLVTVQ